MGLSSLKSLYWAPKHASFLQSRAYRPFKVIQGRWFWYKSKAHMVLLLVRHSNQGPIMSDMLQLFGWKLQIFFHPTLMWRPSSDVLFGNSWGLGKFTTKKLVMGLFSSEDRMIVVWVILIQHQRVTDTQTDRRTDVRICYSSYGVLLTRCKKHYICDHISSK